MDKTEFVKFYDVNIEKREEFHSSKKSVPIDFASIDKRVICDEFPYIKKASKYFTDYKNNEKVTSLCVMLPKISGYLKNFDDAKTMSYVFLVDYEKLLTKYNETLSKI